MIREIEKYEELKRANKIYGTLPPERFAKFDVPRLSRDIRERLATVPDITCELSDSLDRLGYQIGLCTVPSHKIFPLKFEYSVVGTAVTQRSCPARIRRAFPESEPKRLMSTRDIPYFAEEGDIWVIDAKGCESSHFGEIAAKIMREHLIAGTVIDGLIRDCETVKLTNHPFWCRGFTPYSGMYRIETVELNGPVTIGGIQVNAGDLVAADANGLCAVPQAIVAEVFEEMCANGVC